MAYLGLSLRTPNFATRLDETQTLSRDLENMKNNGVSAKTLNE